MYAKLEIIMSIKSRLSYHSHKLKSDGAATMKPVCKQVLSGDITNGYISVYHIHINYKYSYYLLTSLMCTQFMEFIKQM